MISPSKKGELLAPFFPFEGLQQPKRLFFNI